MQRTSSKYTETNLTGKINRQLPYLLTAGQERNLLPSFIEFYTSFRLNQRQVGRFNCKQQNNSPSRHHPFLLQCSSAPHLTGPTKNTLEREEVVQQNTAHFNVYHIVAHGSWNFFSLFLNHSAEDKTSSSSSCAGWLAGCLLGSCHYRLSIVHAWLSLLKRNLMLNSMVGHTQWQGDEECSVGSWEILPTRRRNWGRRRSKRRWWRRTRWNKTNIDAVGREPS